MILKALSFFLGWTISGKSNSYSLWGNVFFIKEFLLIHVERVADLKIHYLAHPNVRIDSENN